MLSFVTISSLLLALIGTTSADTFTATVSLPGSILDGQPINAAGQYFVVGGSPGNYCPVIHGLQCTNVTETVIANGFNALDVEVPGGQQIYVKSNGALGFTQALSAYIPTGSFIGGFFNLTILSDCTAPRTVINWRSPEGRAEGILACPNAYLANTTSVFYQVFAKTPAFNLTNCVTLSGFSATYLASAYPFGAWQYV